MTSTPDPPTDREADLESTVAVVLAAGAGSRFEGNDHKLVTSFRGRPLIQWVLSAVAQVGFAEVVVVGGSVDLAPVVADAVGDGATVVVNHRWAQGQATSLATGVEAARRGGYRAMVVGLGDQPLVPAEAWRTVATTPGPIVAASFDGRRRPPLKFSRSVWDLLPVTGDEGARTLLRERADLVRAVACGGNPVDIDTLEDHRQWN